MRRARGEEREAIRQIDEEAETSPSFNSGSQRDEEEETSPRFNPGSLGAKKGHERRRNRRHDFTYLDGREGAAQLRVLTRKCELCPLEGHLRNSES